MSPVLVPIDNGDTVSRQIFKPRDFEFDGAGPLSLKKSLVFPSKEQYCESVNCHRLVTDFPAAIYTQGHSQAAARTARRLAEGKKGFTYEGFCQVLVESVRAVRADDHSFDVVHTPKDAPENDNYAHCDIKLKFPDRKPKSAQRNLAIQLLADAFSGLTVAAPPTSP